ncbi:BZ3501_MvSof-1269-A2-R1_Chr12-2g03528 [Microbotryum saponariae]|nr:BZ3501_MvSof-1269-A2-R1_Chr12-2g03528 [Microbotryum saponariae]
MGTLESHSPFRDMDTKPNLANCEHERPAGLSAFSSLLQRFRHATATSTGSRDQRDWIDPSSESSLSDLDDEHDICYGSSSDDDNFALSSRTSSRLVEKRKKRKRSTSSKPALPSSPPKKLATTPALKYADPSVYADLDPLTDYLVPGLDLVMCGINPGCQSARNGHHCAYLHLMAACSSTRNSSDSFHLPPPDAHPSNHFYKCLHQSGLTPRRVDPSACRKLIKKCSIGLTNLVERPTRQETELKKDEKRAGCASLLVKIEKNRPHFVAFAGLDVGRVFRDYLVAHEGAKRTYEYRPDQGLPPVVPLPILDASYDSDEADYFVPKSRTPVKRHQSPRPKVESPLGLKKEDAHVDVHIKTKKEEIEGRQLMISGVDTKIETEPKPLPKDWARDLGLQPVILSFPPYGKHAQGSTRRTKTYLWLFPSPSGLVRPYQLPDKIDMHVRLRETIQAVKRGDDPFADFRRAGGEVHEYLAEMIMGGEELA